MPDTRNSSKGLTIIRRSASETSSSSTNKQPISGKHIPGNISSEIVVVAARFALDEYLRCSAYLCQTNRSFRPGVRMAFYANGKIDRHIPKILRQVEAIYPREIETRTDISSFDREGLRAVYRKIDSWHRAEWDKLQLKVVFLSAPDSPDTLMLPQDIVNDLTSENGKVAPFTQKQRYVPLSRFEKGPKTTSELLR